MAELRFPDIGASFRDGQAFGTQQRLLGESEQRRSRLADLAGQAYGASGEQRSALIGQAVGVDPAAGMQLESSLNSSQDARTKTLVNASKLLTSVPEQQRAALYQQMKPDLARLGLQLPDQYDATVEQTAQSIVQAYADTGATPAGLREFQGMTAGLSADDVMKARRVNLGLDPRQSSAAIQYKEVVGSDGRTRYVAFDPREVGAQVVGGGDVYGSGVGGPKAAVGSDHLATFQNLAQQFGAQISSTNRSPEHNARVGGVPNSQHLRGTAGDFVVPQQTKAAFVQAARQAGYEAIDEGDHVHLELPPNRQVAQSGAFVSRSPEEQAALTTSATEAAKFPYAVQTQQMQDASALGRATEEDRIKREGERAGKQKDRDDAYRVYQAGVIGLTEGLEGTETGPILGRIPAVTGAQQSAEGGVAAMAPILKQLFRSAGEGVFTDKDQEMLIQMLPTRKDTPQARNFKLANIDRIVQAKLGAAPQQDAPRSSSVSTTPAKFSGFRILD